MKRAGTQSAVAAAVAAGACAAAVGALAAATPVFPPPGATIKGPYPLFTWRLPAGERADAIAIARSPATDAQGALVEDEVVQGETFRRDRRTWRPTRPLPAGRYWWSVTSRDTATEDVFHSRPVRFTIPLALRVLKVETPRDLYARKVVVGVRWAGNAERVTVIIRMLAGRRFLAADSKTVSHRIGTVSRTTFRLVAKPVPRGTRITFRARLRASS